MEAEEEKLLEHAKNAVHALTDKKQKWTKKVGSFLLEILVIVIAVNITIWFHNWNDKKHERQLEKEFLIDIRENLIADTTAIRDNINFYTNIPLVYYDSVQSQLNSNKINAQYIDDYKSQLVNNIVPIYDYGIFQSFSSAGNLRLIENRKLLSDIVSLYSVYLPLSERDIRDMYLWRREGFDKYVGTKIGGVDGKLSTIIHQPDVKYLIKTGRILIMNINEENERVNKQIVAVINDIDKELKEKFKQ